MNKNELEKSRNRVIDLITQKVILRNETESDKIFGSGGDLPVWLLDFRLAFSHKQFLEDISLLFWEKFKDKEPLQIGGLESASLPLLTSLVLSGQNSTGFYIRKSRKKRSQLKQIEGDVEVGRGDIVLVDDLINSGSSFIKQIKILKDELGVVPKAIFAIVKFRDIEFYKAIAEEGIEIHTLLSLKDIGLSLRSDRFTDRDYKLKWKFTHQKPHLFEQGVKHIPVFVGNKIIMTDDAGWVHCLHSDSGKLIWKKRVILTAKINQSTFKSVVVSNSSVIVATYNGQLMSLDLETGQPQFRHQLVNNFTANLEVIDEQVVVSCSDGVGKSANSLMFFSLKEQTHRAVLFNDSAFIGSIILDNFKKYIFVATRANEIYCLTSKGELVWTAKLEGENNAGVLFNDYGDVIAINSDGDTKVLSRHNGKVIDSYQLPVFHNSVPVCRKHKLYGATLGREIYCFDYRSKKMNWLIETNGRMYSKPTLHRDYLLVGDNNGYVHILDKKTGEKLYQLLVSERVTNPIKISKESIFVSTFANELYSFENFLDETKQVENEMKHPTINHDSNNQT